MNVLVLNVGSSTLKFQLIRTDADAIADDADERVAGGSIERIGGEAIIRARVRDDESRVRTAQLRDIRAAIDWVLRWLTAADSGGVLGSVGEIQAVGHRVVHGGEAFQQSVLVDDPVLRQVEATIDLARCTIPTI